MFLGGGMRTFSTNNSSIAALLITLYPRLPTGPNDNRCHLQVYQISVISVLCDKSFEGFVVYSVKLSSSEESFLQAFRHLYVLATEARWIQTVDVDTGLPVYAPLEVTIKETEHYAESSFCEVTPCLLPERAIVSLNGL